MIPKGHCFFCNCLTEYAIGKIPICEDCMDELYHKIFHSHRYLEIKYDFAMTKKVELEGFK